MQSQIAQIAQPVWNPLSIPWCLCPILSPYPDPRRPASASSGLAVDGALQGGPGGLLGSGRPGPADKSPASQPLLLCKALLGRGWGVRGAARMLTAEPGGAQGQAWLWRPLYSVTRAQRRVYTIALSFTSSSRVLNSALEEGRSSVQGQALLGPGEKAEVGASGVETHTAV
jgi:hypothetical protein